MRSWDDLNLEEKEKIWKFLEKYFFNNDLLNKLYNNISSESYIYDEIF